MRVANVHGLIRRRVLVNFRVDAETMSRFLPSPFRPKLQRGHAIAGICLIRLEQIRPAGLPRFCGVSSENAAHRIAVVWDGPDGTPREGVFIPRRDTGSWLNHLAGGRIFPGEHGLADFRVNDSDGRVAISVKAPDGGVAVELHAHESDDWPEGSCFESLEESSAFFETGSAGYSVTRGSGRLDGIRLQTEGWRVRPLAVERVESSFFADTSAFPADAIAFDHALIMRDIRHRWQTIDDMFVEPTLGPV